MSISITVVCEFAVQLHRWNVRTWLRLFHTLLINRIPCTRDPKCDVKEHTLEFSTFVMNSQQKLHDCVYALASLYRKMLVWISASKFFSFVIVVVVFVIVVVDDNAVVLVFQVSSFQETRLCNEKILKKHKNEINCYISMHLLLVIQYYFCFNILMYCAKIMKWNLGCKQSLFSTSCLSWTSFASLPLVRGGQDFRTAPYIYHACSSLFIENNTQNNRQPLGIWGYRRIYLRLGTRKKCDKYTRMLQMNAP